MELSAKRDMVVKQNQAQKLMSFLKGEAGINQTTQTNVKVKCVVSIVRALSSRACPRSPVG